MNMEIIYGEDKIISKLLTGAKDEEYDKKRLKDEIIKTLSERNT